MRHLPQSVSSSHSISHQKGPFGARPLRRALRRTATGVAVATLLSLSLAGCGSGSDEDSSGDPSSASSNDADNDDADTSGAATATEDNSDDLDRDADSGGSDGGGTTTAPNANLTTSLLAVDEMPGVNQETAWTEESTGREDDDGTSDCQVGSLESMGAQESVARDFEDEVQDASAEQVIAKFADESAAKKNYLAVQRMLSSCASRLDGDVRKVSKPAAVRVPGGQAHVVLAQHGDNDEQEHEFDGIGLVRKGDRISIIQIDVESMDYNYEPGKEPATLAVKAAARKM